MFMMYSVVCVFVVCVWCILVYVFVVCMVYSVVYVFVVCVWCIVWFVCLLCMYTCVCFLQRPGKERIGKGQLQCQSEMSSKDSCL